MDREQKIAEMEAFRGKLMLYKTFISWREIPYERKLVSLHYFKTCFTAWKQFTQLNRTGYPSDYRETYLKKLFFKQAKHMLRQKWIKERSQIMEKALIRERELRLMKVCFLILKEKNLQKKTRGFATRTARDFYACKLLEKAVKGLKRNWVQKQRALLLD